MIERPQSDEYAEYFGQYIQEVPDGDIVEFLDKQLVTAHELLDAVPEEKRNHRYAEGKWSVNEVIGHICDSERMFSMRAMAFARQDPVALPGFDQEIYVKNGFFESRTLKSCVQEFDAVRTASLALFRNLDDRTYARQGRANNVVFSVRSVAWIIGGHAKHHLGVLRERYLSR